VSPTYYVSPEWTFRSLLYAPSLTATANGAEQIDLTWTDNSDEESNYIIDRSLNGSDWAQLVSKDEDATSHSDTGLTASTKYYYRIRAYHADWGSSDYNTGNATTTGTPSSVAATGASFYRHNDFYPPTKEYGPTTIGRAGQRLYGGTLFERDRTIMYFAIPAGAISSASLSSLIGGGRDTAFNITVRKTVDCLPFDKTDFTFTDSGEMGTYTDPLATLSNGQEMAITLDTDMITPSSTLWVCVTTNREYVSPTQPSGYEMVVCSNWQLLLNGASRV